MNALNTETRTFSTPFVVLVLIALGAALTAGHLHGFSFSAWHAAIDGSPPCEVLMNDAKGYRSDDWIVSLPHMLAQRADTPSFSSENSLIGDGRYNMLITGAAPVRDPVVFFRPQVWGYFISGDIGMACQWWFNALGVWLAVWLVLRRLTGNDEWTSACGATALLFSPFFQAWSLNCAPSVIFAGGVLLAMVRLRTAVSARDLVLAAAGLAWCGVALMLTFQYMPYLVTLLYLVLFVFPGIALGRPAGATRLKPIGMRWLCGALAILFILGLGAHLVTSNRETIQAIQHSEYPGQRISNGGDQTIWHLFRGNILGIKPPTEWRDFNPCEGSAFFLVFPVVIAALARDWWRTRKPPSILIFGISGYIIFLLIWNLAGFTDSLSRWSLMSRAPPFRTLIGLGLADLFLLAIYVSTRRQAAPALRADTVSPWIVCALWIVFLIGLGFKLSRYFPEYSLGTALTGGLLVMVLAPLLYRAPRLVMPVLMITSILTTYDVNPLARGGTAFIEENPLSQKIKALDRESMKAGRRPIWIAYDDLALPNLFRMIGARALNGVHAYPQLEFWKKLDPEGRYRHVYNRYAHVVFELPSAPTDFNIRLVQTDIVTVCLHPDNPRFAVLRADYILCQDNQTEVLDRVPTLNKIYTFAGKHIYRVNQSDR
ncbi:MAG: hypothetical protein KKE37_04550 [Verrucomicrobia bacterium]|nr:hypothetical protein [Verrucomicrobiota bacterium]MBU4292220.1 hypothetical protein [Verrucomicrobiota bacterium]MBU4428607.1 hypothetical protein [Verrucomicrobiota bacterium]MCG2678386.1 hypothetical protein [Kiritimatiellia bacterium]